MTPLLAVALTLVVTFASMICIGTYRSRCLRDPLDELESLDGDPLDEGWGRL